MHPRSVVALSVGCLAAIVALGVGVWKQLGVKSYGYPAGRVVRAGEHLCVLIETCDPYMPSLKGVSERDKNYSYALWVIPQTGDGEVRTIRLARGVSSSARTHNIGAQHFENGILWLTIDELQGINLAVGQPTATAPPASLVNAPISQLMGGSPGTNPLDEFRAQTATLPSGGGQWLVLANEDEAKTQLKPGARLYDNATAAATAGYKTRTLQTVTIQPGPIPRVESAKRLGDREFRRGAFMRSAKGGNIVRYINPDGFLVVHEAGDPVHPSIHLSRVNTDGSIMWTADTRIGRLTQVLAHDTLPAFVGELPGQLTEPMLSVVNISDGSVKFKSLKGPVN